MADDVLRAVQAVHTGPFEISSVSLDRSVAVALHPEVADDLWMGPGREPVTFEATIPEWSVDAVGWIVLLLAGACRDENVDTTVLVGVARA